MRHGKFSACLIAVCINSGILLRIILQIEGIEMPAECFNHNGKIFKFICLWKIAKQNRLRTCYNESVLASTL